MISYAEARAEIAKLPLTTESTILPLAACGGRVLAESLTARSPSPAFTNSAMDGYAFRRSDLKFETLTVGPTLFAKISEVATAEAPPPGTCARIMTGAPLPAWADSVVPFEHTHISEGKVRLLQVPTPGDNIRRIGEDLDEGDPLLERGTYMDPERVMIAAAFGFCSLPVVLSPEVLLCSSGDELIDPGKPLPPGGLYNSNKAFLTAALDKLGLAPTATLHLPDHEDQATAAVASLLHPAKSQLILTTGAVSAGDLDFMPRIACSLGFSTLFHKVAIRPGKPVFVATRGRSVWLGLPGNPLAACTGWYFFALPILKAMCGLPLPQRRSLVLANDVRKPEGLRCFYRATVRGDEAVVSDKQGSAHFRASRDNTAYVELPEGGSLISASTRVEAIII